YAHASQKAARFMVASGVERVELHKEGELWKVATYSGLVAADPQRVKSFLDSLEAVTLEDVISHSPAQAAVFEVTPSSGAHVSVWNVKGKALADGFFGKQAPDYAHIHFRFADQPDVYLAAGLFRGELSPGKPETWKKVETSTVTVSSRKN